jgi:uncharacterized protein (TIGR03083 family)
VTITPLIAYPNLLDVLEVEGERLATSTVGSDPESEVPNLSGMRLGEVVRHVGSVYRMVVSWLHDGARPTRWQRQPGDDQSLVDYFRAGLLEVVHELARHDPLEGCPTWWPAHQNYGFWYRRLAHETTVHRYDVQMGGAAATVGGIPPQMALDGVDEILTLWFTHRLGVLGIADMRPARIAIHTGDRRWIAQITPTGTSAWRADTDEKVDAIVSTDPAGMYLWLWGRRPGAHVLEAGDPEAVAQLQDLLRVATR